MQVGDAAFVHFSATKKDKPKWCRCIIQEINGAVCVAEIWDGKRFTKKPLMLRDLKEKQPE